MTVPYSQFERVPALIAGSGLNISNGVITNTSPDRTVSITQGSNLSITSNYPNFSIAGNINPVFNQITIGDSGGVESNVATINLNHLLPGSSSTASISQISAVKTGTSGGELQILTKADSGTLQERLRITDDGAWGLTGANYGTNGQILTSRGSSLPPVWTDKVRITKFKGTNNTASGAAGAVHSIIFNPSGWVPLRPDNTFCEEYGAPGSGSSSATRDGSIKILETGTYILSTKFVLFCSTLAFDIRGRVMKIPAAGGSPIYIGQTQLTSYINPLGSSNNNVISARIATTVEIEELVVGDRILLQMFAQGAAVTAGTNTQIIIEKVED